MQHVRRRVEHPPQPVAAKIAHHRHAVGLDIGLDRVADIAKGGTGAHRPDPLHQRVMGDLDQPFRPPRRFARHIHPAAIAIPAIDDHRDIDVQDIAVFQQLWPRNAVAHHMVDRNARRMLIAAIADGGRPRIHRRDHFGDRPVKLFGGDTGHHQRAHRIQNGRSHPPCPVHPGKVVGFIDTDTVLGQTATAFFHERHSASFAP